HRIFVIGALGRSDEIGRHKLAEACRSGEASREHYGLPRVALLFAWISNGRFAFESIPRDTGDRIHALPHFLEHLSGVGIVPVQSNTACDLIDDPEIGARITRWIERLAAELNHSIGVRHGAALFGPCCGWEYDIGEVCSLGEKNVLDDQVVE